MSLDSLVTILNEHGFRKDALYIAWKSECFRSYQTASVLGMPLAMVYPKRVAKGTLGTLSRYAYSSLATLRLLFKRRPRVLAVLNQPLPLVLISSLYARLASAHLILDGHSKPFSYSFNSLHGRIYRNITKTATFTINHNSSDSQIVKNWGARSILLEALPLTLPAEVQHRITEKEAYVACVCSYAADEPLDVIIEAARRLAPLTIKITGNWTKSGVTPEARPDNLHPTGFLPIDQYYELLAGAKMVITLSKRNWIMQMAVEEAMLLGVPVVTNHSPVLEKVLGAGAVFTALDSASLASAVQLVLEHESDYQKAIKLSAEAWRYQILDRLTLVQSLLDD